MPPLAACTLAGSGAATHPPAPLAIGMPPRPTGQLLPPANWVGTSQVGWWLLGAQDILLLSLG